MANIEQWVADNYDELVADEGRSETYDSVAERAESSGDAALAGWARAKAAGQNVDVTPSTGTYVPPNTVKRRSKKEDSDEDLEVESPILGDEPEEVPEP